MFYLKAFFNSRLAAKIWGMKRSVSCQDLRDGEISQLPREISQLPRSEGWRDQSAAKIWGMERSASCQERSVSCQDMRDGESSQLPRSEERRDQSSTSKILRDGVISQLPTSERWRDQSSTAKIWGMEKSVSCQRPRRWDSCQYMMIDTVVRTWRMTNCHKLRDQILTKTWGMRQLSEPEG